jgi:hypothetical protein
MAQGIHAAVGPVEAAGAHAVANAAFAESGGAQLGERQLIMLPARDPSDLGLPRLPRRRVVGKR